MRSLMVRPRRDDEKATCEVLASVPADSVDGLPRDGHRHHGALAGTVGELQRETHDLGVRVVVRACEVVEQAFAVFWIAGPPRSARSLSRPLLTGRRKGGRPRSRDAP